MYCNLLLLLKIKDSWLLPDSVTAGCDHFGHRELTVSSRWTVTVANFFSWASYGDCLWVFGRIRCRIIKRWDCIKPPRPLFIIPQILSEFHGVFPLLVPQLNIILIASMDHIADVSLPLTVDSLATYLPTLCQMEWRHGVRVTEAPIINTRSISKSRRSYDQMSHTNSPMHRAKKSTT